MCLISFAPSPYVHLKLKLQVNCDYTMSLLWEICWLLCVEIIFIYTYIHTRTHPGSKAFGACVDEFVGSFTVLHEIVCIHHVLSTGTFMNNKTRHCVFLLPVVILEYCFKDDDTFSVCLVTVLVIRI